MINPNSNYYLAINTGFPNIFDKANDRDGSFLMIHGDCLSTGCYAMTDEQMAEIYSLARDAFLSGRESFQIQAYPFRMTPANLAHHRTNPNIAFWKMLKIGNDHFEVSHLEPKVDVCNRRYVFDAQQRRHSAPVEFKNPVRGDLISPDIFAARGADRIFSSDLATALVTLEGRPWGERNGQCPISANAIAVMLAPLDQEVLLRQMPCEHIVKLFSVVATRYGMADSGGPPPPSQGWH